MELKPRPVEVDRFLELDEHLLNRNGVTSVTGSGQSAAVANGNDGHQAAWQPSDAAVAAASGSGSSAAASERTTADQPLSEQQRIVRIVISYVCLVGKSNVFVCFPCALPHEHCLCVCADGWPSRSFVTMILTFWALATAGIIDINTYTTTRMLLTLLSLGSVCTFMRIALLKREQRYASKMKAS
jgi:hypothetical protein